VLGVPAVDVVVEDLDEPGNDTIAAKRGGGLPST
jgi:hypothetical protein